GVEGIDALVARARESGLAVDSAVEGQPRPVAPTIGLTAYRVTQEALTNVVRHARAASAAVVLRYDPAAIIVEVLDDGNGARGGPVRPGHGLVGMRERVAAVGGSLDAGPLPGRGFRVRACLPTTANAR
ncbi:MAG: sensor histidine kinase, partial [Acidimicrobiales bacterium]